MRFPGGRFGVLVALLGLVGAPLAVIALTSSTQAGADVVSFNCTGATQTWTVPAGETSATFTVFGAAGGGGQAPPGDGGLGGETTATIAVTPGAILQINVGCHGGNGLITGPGGVGGFNGGGASGANGAILGAGGGGGASDVRIGGNLLTDRAIVAGGGGGSGGNVATGGAGGDPNGTAGDNGTGTATGGGPGTQIGGGAFGVGNGTGLPGVAGSPGMGGTGGDLSGSPTANGGGGGGGLFGGGGGGSDSTNNFGGAGGGGSSFGPVGATFETGVTAPGITNGDGLITITFTSASPATAIVVTPQFTG